MNSLRFFGSNTDFHVFLLSQVQSEQKQQASQLNEQLRERQRELIREQELRSKAEDTGNMMIRDEHVYKYIYIKYICIYAYM